MPFMRAAGHDRRPKQLHEGLRSFRCRRIASITSPTPLRAALWFGDHGVRLCDWSWDVEKKILTVRRGRRGEQIYLSNVDLERLDPQELGRRLSEAAFEASQRGTSHR